MCSPVSNIFGAPTMCQNLCWGTFTKMSVTRPCPGFEMERELCEQLRAVKCVHQEVGTMHPAPSSAHSGVDAPEVLVKLVHHSVELENCIEDQVAGWHAHGGDGGVRGERKDVRRW